MNLWWSLNASLIVMRATSILSSTICICPNRGPELQSLLHLQNISCKVDKPLVNVQLVQSKTGKGLWLLLQFTPCWFDASHRWQSRELPCYTAQDTGYGQMYTCSKLVKKGIQETCRCIHNCSDNGGVLKNGRFSSGIDLNLPLKHITFKCRALLWSCHVTGCQGQSSRSTSH